MKVGSFVGKKGMSLNSEEIEIISSNIKNCYDAYLSEIPNIGELIITTEKDYSDAIVLDAIVPFKEDWVMRHCDKDCYVPKEIRIVARKKLGYDEAKHNVNRRSDDCPLDMTSYSIDINLMGDFRKYHGRIIERGVGITQTTYEFGTELCDIIATSGIMKIARYLRSSKATNMKF